MSKTSLMAVALCAVAAAGAAQETPAPAAAPQMRAPRVAVIDVQRIFAESQLGKNYAARIEALEKDVQGEATKLQAQIQKAEADIKDMQDKLQAQASSLNEEARTRRAEEIAKKTRDYERLVEDSNAEMRRRRERAGAQLDSLQAEFQQKIQPHIEAVAREKAVDILLLRSQVVHPVNREFDLSPAVVAKVDAAEKAAAAKPAPAKPAASASPAPAAPASPAPAAPPTPAPSPSPQP